MTKRMPKTEVNSQDAVTQQTEIVPVNTTNDSIVTFNSEGNLENCPFYYRVTLKASLYYDIHCEEFLLESCEFYHPDPFIARRNAIMYQEGLESYIDEYYDSLQPKVQMVDKEPSKIHKPFEFMMTSLTFHAKDHKALLICGDPNKIPSYLLENLDSEYWMLYLNDFLTTDYVVIEHKENNYYCINSLREFRMLN